MLITLYPLSYCVWSFTPERGAIPMRVEVPDGSKLKAVRGLSMQLLFVPNPDDPCVTRGLWANEVAKEAMSGESERFRIVQNSARSRVAS